MLPNGPEGEASKGPTPYELEGQYRQLLLGGEDPRANIYRPLENLRFKNFFELEDGMKKEIAEDLKDSVLSPFLSFSGEIQSIVEGASAKKYTYPAQNALEFQIRGITQTEQLLSSTPDGQNEVILGRVLSDQLRQKSTLTIYNWSLPYLTMYWSGMDSLRLLSERGAQLPMADMSRFFDKPEEDWIDKSTQSLRESSALAKKELQAISEQKNQEAGEFRKSLDELQSQMAKKELEIEQAKSDKNEERQREAESEKKRLGIAARQEEQKRDSVLRAFAEREKAKEEEVKRYPEAIAATPLVTVRGKDTEEGENLTIEETFGERFSRYTADTYFWTQIRGEMNTFNPIFGETLIISETMQQFVFDISNIDPERRLIIGNEPPMMGKTLVSAGKELFVNTLDYFNNIDFTNSNRSNNENDRRWIVATTAAMAMCNAKEELDGLPLNIRDVNRDSPEWQRYAALFKKVHEKTIEIMKNYDVHKKSFLEHKMAKTAFDLAYAISFGSFSVGDWGWAYKWKKNNDNTWSFEGEQGDPTASGDAFTARRPFFHEVVYAGIKNRVSAPIFGVLMPIDGPKAQELANALLSELEEANQRKVMIERIKRGEQPHLATFFGVIGAFKEDLGTVGAWKKGEELRKKVGKNANPNLVATIEKLVVFIPTPFKDEAGKNLVYPMLMPQFQIGLFDMLRAEKYGASAGDLLRQIWKKDEQGGYSSASFADGGRRLTLRDINFKDYGGYADDSRAVNDNFISQVYAPLYGAVNPKSVDAIVANPAVGIASAIKAVDIGSRTASIVVKDTATDNKERYAQRPSLEIIYGSSVVFQNLALGKYGLIGRGSVERMSYFLNVMTPGQKSEGKADNLYTVLRSIEDFLGVKQGYEGYSASFYLTFLAMTEALKPITIASEKMAADTTKRMEKVGTTGVDTFKQENSKFV